MGSIKPPTPLPQVSATTPTYKPFVTTPS